jgi:hypothetical protein
VTEIWIGADGKNLFLMSIAVKCLEVRLYRNVWSLQSNNLVLSCS